MEKLTEIAPTTTRHTGAVAPPPKSPAPRRAPLHIAIDAALVLAGFAIAYWMRYLVNWPPPFEAIVSEVATENFVAISAFLPIALLLMLLLIGQFVMRGLYRDRTSVV